MKRGRGRKLNRRLKREELGSKRGRRRKLDRRLKREELGWKEEEEES